MNKITIQDLATAFKATDHLVYENMLKNANISTEARKFLLRKNSEIRFARDCAQFRRNQVALLEKTLANHKNASEKAESDLASTYLKLEEANKVLAKAHHELFLAQNAVKDAEKNIEELNRTYTFQQKIASKENLQVKDFSCELDTAKKALHESENYILVHPTATLSSLSKKVGSGIFVCTKYDAESMHYRKCVDQVIDTTKYDYADGLLDNYREYFSSEEEFNSGVAYINLILKFVFDDIKYETLCNSDAIICMLYKIL